MSVHRYYRCTNAAALDAAKHYFDTVETIRKKARAFVKRFGGLDALFFMACGYRFAGIQFSPSQPPKDEHLWTKPTKSGERHPKAGVKEGAALRAEWKKHWPEGEAKDVPWLAALGLERSFFSRPGMTLLKDGSALYVASVNPITIPNTVEITATEYLKAKEA